MNNFRGGFGGMNLQNMMRQAQKMQEDMQKAKAEIEATEFKGTAGGGMVEVVITGDRKVKSVNLKPEIVDPDDIEMLEDLIVASTNDALSKIVAMEKEKMPSMPAGF